MTTRKPPTVDVPKLIALRQDLLILPRGGKQWRAVFARYRRTAHWKDRSKAKLEIHPFCEVCELMGNRMVKATEVHHAKYNYFHEAILGELVSCCKTCHLGYEQRRMRRNRR